jgi:hypothetical protein
LQRLQAEAAQLEVEVQATLDERQKLTIEMENLDVVTPGSLETNSQKEADFPSMYGTIPVFCTANTRYQLPPVQLKQLTSLPKWLSQSQTPLR